VSINPRPVSLLLAHFGALTSSPERPLRPLPAPAAGEAQSPPLTPRTRVHASPLHFVLSCGRVSGRERRPGEMPARSRRAPPHFCVLAAASCTRASSAVRSCAGGSDRIPLRFEWAAHRGPVDRVHGAVHHARAHRRRLDSRSTARRWQFC
jgi:hypothetical protein